LLPILDNTCNTSSFFSPDKLKELPRLILYWPSFKSFVAMYTVNCSKDFLELVPFWDQYHPVSHQSKHTVVIYVFLSATTCCLVLFHHSVHIHDTADEGCFSMKIFVTFSRHILCESITNEDSLLKMIHFSHAMYTCCLQLITCFIAHLDKIQCVG